MSQFKTSSNTNGSMVSHQLDPEVVVRAQRRQFSVAYKLRILQEADGCKQPGQTGALLRREGLYASQLSDWRRERAASEVSGLGKQKQSRKNDDSSQENAVLRQENVRLKAQLAQADLIISTQKKLTQVLEQGLTLSKGMNW